MTATFWFQNLGSYFLQTAILTGAGSLLPLVFRLRIPRARLFYWQALLVACVLLPALQPWTPLVSEARETVTVSTATVALAAVSGPVPGLRLTPVEIAIAVLAAGALLRLLWLGVGLLRLRRYRQRSEPLAPMPPELAALQRRLGVEAAMYICPDMSSPITFGSRRPLILFPPAYMDMPAAQQAAIACHELLHIRRRDWVFMLAEELIRALLWFHPAIWWLLAYLRRHDFTPFVIYRLVVGFGALILMIVGFRSFTGI